MAKKVIAKKKVPAKAAAKKVVKKAAAKKVAAKPASKKVVAKKVAAKPAAKKAVVKKVATKPMAKEVAIVKKAPVKTVIATKVPTKVATPVKTPTIPTTPAKKMAVKPVEKKSRPNTEKEGPKTLEKNDFLNLKIQKSMHENPPLYDYSEEEVVEHAPLTPIIRETPKVGRNEPCPCGSGMKYKKCHGNT